MHEFNQDTSWGLAIEVIVVTHYSIQAVDIFIQEITAAKGWHLGDAVQYQVKNCAWESRIELQIKTRHFGHHEFEGKQVFQNGDRQKMLEAQNITQMAMQQHLAGHLQNTAPVHWLPAE